MMDLIATMLLVEAVLVGWLANRVVRLRREKQALLEVLWQTSEALDEAVRDE